eukprot:4620243-Lingulodinium_polyedra.AAC.1
MGPTRLVRDHDPNAPQHSRFLVGKCPSRIDWRKPDPGRLHRLANAWPETPAGHAEQPMPLLSRFNCA